MLKRRNKYYRFLVFLIGVIATIAYRVIVILNHYSPIWVEIAWYIGTLGFIWYFAHRWIVEKRRDRYIEEMGLAQKIEKGETLSAQEREATVYILRGLKTSLSKWNYIAIFLLSLIALVYAILS